MSERLQVAVGDTVVVTSAQNRGVTAQECTVTKIGRKYVYVTGYSNYGFDLVTGCANTDYGSKPHLYTQADWMEKQRRSEIERRLRTDHGIGTARGARFDQDTDTLQAVLDLLDAPQRHGRRHVLAESAALVRAFADARAAYLLPSELEPGAFHDLSASQQWLVCEISGYRKAADVIEDPIDAAQLTLPTWKLDEWPATVAAIRAAAAEPGDGRG